MLQTLEQKSQSREICPHSRPLQSTRTWRYRIPAPRRVESAHRRGASCHNPWEAAGRGEKPGWSCAHVRWDMGSPPDMGNGMGALLTCWVWWSARGRFFDLRVMPCRQKRACRNKNSASSLSPKKLSEREGRSVAWRMKLRRRPSHREQQPFLRKRKKTVTAFKPAPILISQAALQPISTW